MSKNTKKAVVSASAVAPAAVLRTLEQLVDLEDPGMPVVRDLLNSSSSTTTKGDGKAGRHHHHVTYYPLLPSSQPSIDEETNPNTTTAVLSTTSRIGATELLKLQVTTRSPMGSIAYEMEGITTHNGLIRILAAGGGRTFTRSITSQSEKYFNFGKEGANLTNNHVGGSAMWIGDDVFGGIFALNGGALSSKGIALRSVAYLCPEGLEWDDLEIGYSDFIEFAGGDRVFKFYEHLLWKGWEDVVANVSPSQCITFFPPLFAKVPGGGKRSHKIISSAEVFDLLIEQSQ